MFVDESYLHPLHCLAVVFASVPPDHKSSVLNIAMSEITLSHGMVFGFGCSLFFEAFLFVFELFFLWYFRFKLSSGSFKFVLRIEKFDCIEASFQKSLSSESLYVPDHHFFFIKEFLFPLSFTPVFPSSKFILSHLSFGLLHCMLECQENSLFISGFSNHISKYVLSLLHVLLLYIGEPFNERFTLHSVAPPKGNSFEEIFLCSSSFREVSPSAKIVSQDYVLITCCKTLYNFSTGNFIGKYSFSV